MMRFLLLVLLFLPFSSLSAQENSTPILEMDVPESEAIPGQPLRVSITILVPTWMPKPPVWPTFDAPNLMIRLPERSTGPTSRSVSGETWSGVRRSYQVFPMVPGEFVLPAQNIPIVYSDPENGQEVTVTVTTEEVRITGLLPEGAEGLDPFIAATALSLSDEVQGDPLALQAGDSFTRIISAQIEGNSPMVLPALIAATDLPGLRAYPDSPGLEESEQRGLLSGTRSERVVYLAEGAVKGELPAIELRWYNLETGAVETASVPAVEVRAEAGPAGLEPEKSIGELVLRVVPWLFGAIVVGGGLWLLRPRLQRVRTHLRAKYMDSERYAWTCLQRAVRDRDLQQTNLALQAWMRHIEHPDFAGMQSIKTALLGIGQSRYAVTAGMDEKAAWDGLSHALRAVRQHSGSRVRMRISLPPLNPTS